MSIGNVISIVAPVFIIILIGYIIGKFKKADIKPLIDLVVYIAAPCLILSSISRSELNVDDFLKISLSSFLVIAILGVIVFIGLRLAKSKREGLYLPLTIGNTGYMGYPIALFAYGALGLSMAVVYDAMNSLILFSLGIYIVHHKNDIMEAFKVPLIYAVILGILFNLFKVQIPEMIFKPIDMIGIVTIPLALLILGYRLNEIKLSEAKLAFILSFFRVAGGFVVAILVVKLLSVQGVVKNVIILEAAMPSAVMSMIICHRYRKDSNLVASIVLISTLMSIVSIPVILSIL